MCDNIQPEQFVATMEMNTTELTRGDTVFRFVDTPGVVSLLSGSGDEKGVHERLLDPEVDQVLFVADIRNLHRSIALFHQVTLFEKPVTVAVNGIDREQDFLLDYEKITSELRCPVTAVSAVSGDGIEELMERLPQASVPPIQLSVPRIRRALSTFSGDGWTYGRLLLACVFPDAVLSRVPETSGDVETLRDVSRDLARNNPFLRNDLYLVDLSFSAASHGIPNWKKLIAASGKLRIGDRIGLWVQRPLTGVPVVILLMALMYLFVGLFGAQILVEWMEKWVFGPVLEPFFLWVTRLFPSTFVQRAVLDPDFGLVPTGLFLVLGIVFPVLLTYYVFIGFLETSGYIPRLSVLLDRLMRPMGLNGKGVMPLVMGFSCITMAIMTTRMLDTKKEKIIASFLLILGLPCAPLLSTMFIILGQLPFAATLVLFGIIFSQIFLGGVVANRFLPGVRSELILEIPPITLPDPLWVFKSAWIRTWAFMKEAIPLFLLASFLLFLANEAGFLAWLEEVSSPLVTRFWGLPSESVQVFMKTMIRRENGVAELARLQAGFTGNQMLITLLIMTFLMPCVNATFMMFKERGVKVAVSIIGVVLVYTTLVGGVVNFTLRILGVQW